MSTFTDSQRSGGLGQGAYDIRPRATDEVPLTINLLAGQTANALNIKNSAGSILFSIDPSGNGVVVGTLTSVTTETATNLSLSGTLSVTGTSVFTGAIA